MSKRKMKDSGVEWLGDVPEEWRKMRVRSFLRNVSEKNHPEAEVLSLYRELGVVPKNSRDDNHNVTGEDTSQYKFVQRGDLVINKMKAWQGSLAVSDYEGIVSPAYYVCRFHGEKVFSRFVHYLLRNVRYAQEFERLSTGMRVGQWDLGIDDFLRVPLFLPPLLEQRKIAAYLDGRCAKIDEMISDAKKTIEEYKAWKSSVIFEAVTGKNIIGKKKSSGVEWMGDIPASWSLTPLKYLISDYKAGPFGSSLITANLLPAGEILVYTPEHIAKRGTSLENNLYLPVSRREEMSQFIVRPGDVIFPIVGSLGRAMLLGPNNPMGIINQRLAKFRLNPKVVDDRYFMRLFGESDFYGQHLEVCCRGTIIVNLTKSIVGAMPFPLPPLGVQREIAHQLDAQCLVIERVIAEKEKMIADLESYKKSLIFECVTGKMEVA